MHRSLRGRTVGDKRRPQTICSLGQSGWAREFYDQKTAGKELSLSPARPRVALAGDPPAVPGQGVLYDESVHIANRNSALERAA